jgi:hypothetical protein
MGESSHTLRVSFYENDKESFMKKLFAVCALIIGFSSVSHAGIMLEPYLGYEMGTTKDNDGKLDGTQLGLRLAWTAPIMFWAGLDYTMGVSAKFKPDASGAPDSDAKRSTLYAVAGVDFPILLRAWFGYGFKNELKLDDYDQKLEGTSTKLGVGFTGLPFVSLNLEYLMEDYDKVNGNSLSTHSKNNAYVLSVSLPWEF